MALNEATEKVSQLENALKRLEFVKKHLNRNASDIKGEIHACVSRNLECLRGREVSLLSQVDKVLGLKEEALHQQEARLNQALGVLKTGLTVLIDDKASEWQLCDALERLNSLELSPGETPHIAFRADNVSLRESIMNYGRVDANGLSLATAFDDPGNPSASLPRHIEEYEDADHHVFYKTVEEVKRANTSTSSITVSIPKLSTRMEDWLQKRCPPPPPSLSKATQSSAPAATKSFSSALRPCTLASIGSATPGKHVGSCNSTPSDTCSLNNWLSLIKNSTDLEEEHDFEIVDNSQANSRKASGTEETDDVLQKETPKEFFQHIKKDSEVWLSPQSSKIQNQVTSMEVDDHDFFQHVPKAAETWLLTACKQLQSLEEMKCVDLFKHISKEQSNWLRHSAQTDQPAKARQAEASETRMDFVEDWKQAKVNESVTYSDSNSSNRKGGHRMQDMDRWLQKKTCKAQKSSFELEDLCRANELCSNLSECVSSPDCASFCNLDASPRKNSFNLSRVDRPLNLSTSEWLVDSSALSSNRESEQSTTKEVILPNLGNSFLQDRSHLRDSMWLSKSRVGSLELTPYTAGSLYKESKEEANQCLRETNISPMVHESQSLPDFRHLEGVHFKSSIADWLMVATPASTNVRGKNVLCDHAMEKEESEGWSICSTPYSFSGDQHANDVEVASHYINKWIM